MFVYEVLVDYEMTTRSDYCSEGLFATKEMAEDYIKSLHLKSWQASTIKERPVKGL